MIVKTTKEELRKLIKEEIDKDDKNSYIEINELFTLLEKYYRGKSIEKIIARGSSGAHIEITKGLDIIFSY